MHFVKAELLHQTSIISEFRIASTSNSPTFPNHNRKPSSVSGRSAPPKPQIDIKADAAEQLVQNQQQMLEEQIALKARLVKEKQELATGVNAHPKAMEVCAHTVCKCNFLACIPDSGFACLSLIFLMSI